MDDGLRRLFLSDTYLAAMYRRFLWGVFRRTPRWDILGYRACILSESITFTARMGAHVLQKNVYSVFRYSPPSVGFAALSDVALAQNGLNNVPLPNPTTIDSAPAVTSVNTGVALRVPRPAEILLGIVFALVVIEGMNADRNT